jgi:hypothetical protein
MVARNNYATKEDLARVEKKLDEMKEDNLNMKLEILTELKEMREEHDMHQYSHTRINDDLQEHDKRLKVLETSN